eukprot:SAG31_NODE_144_length_22617_cov_21.520117_7_plen_219_part_00
MLDLPCCHLPCPLDRRHRCFLIGISGLLRCDAFEQPVARLRQYRQPPLLAPHPVAAPLQGSKDGADRYGANLLGVELDRFLEVCLLHHPPLLDRVRPLVGLLRRWCMRLVALQRPGVRRIAPRRRRRRALATDRRAGRRHRRRLHRSAWGCAARAQGRRRRARLRSSWPLAAGELRLYGKFVGQLSLQVFSNCSTKLHTATGTASVLVPRVLCSNNNK